MDVLIRKLRTQEEEDEQKHRFAIYPQLDIIDSVEDVVQAIEHQKNAPQWFGMGALAARAIALARAWGTTKQNVELACRRKRVKWFKDPLRQDRESDCYINLESWAKWRKVSLQEVLKRLVERGYVFERNWPGRSTHLTPEQRATNRAKQQAARKRKDEKLKKVTEEFYEQRRKVNGTVLLATDNERSKKGYDQTGHRSHGELKKGETT